MRIIGYILVIASLYLLYVGYLTPGLVIFIIGGFISRIVNAGLRGIGLTLMVMTAGYGYHAGGGTALTMMFFFGFAMVSYSIFGSGGDWAFDLDPDDFFDGGGDGGGDGDGSD